MTGSSTKPGESGPNDELELLGEQELEQVAGGVVLDAAALTVGSGTPGTAARVAKVDALSIKQKVSDEPSGG